MTDKQQAKILKKADSRYFKGEKKAVAGKIKKAAVPLADAITEYEKVFGGDKLSGNINFAQALCPGTRSVFRGCSGFYKSHTGLCGS